MIIKTNKTKKVNDVIKPIYYNKLTGKEGTLTEMTFISSQRRDRKDVLSNAVVRTNRKSTKGRRIYFQIIKKSVVVFDKFQKVFSKSGELLRTDRLTTRKLITVKTIKHVQETPDAIRRKIAYNDTLANIELDARKYDKSKIKE